MKLLSAPTLSALANDTVPLVQFVRFEFSAKTLGLCTSNTNMEWDGLIYYGALGLGSISPIEDGPGEVKGLTLTLNGAPAQMISLALDGADEWQGAPVKIYTAILDADYQVASAELEWSGFGDTMTIAEDGEKCTIQATVESTAVDLLRSNVSFYSQSDQLLVDPTDLGFNMVIDKSDEPVVWPAKTWFYR